MSRAVRFLMFWLGFALIVRGVDYVTGDTFPLTSLLHDVNSPEVWGITCIIVGIFIWVSALLKGWKWAYTANISAFAVYIMLAVQIFDMRMLPYPWPPEDVRVITDLMTFAMFSLTLSITIQYRESVKARKHQIVKATSQKLPGGLGV